MRVGVVAPFRPAPQSGIDPDDPDVETGLAHHLTQRANAAPEVATHLDEPTAVREMRYGFLLMATPLKPAGYIAPRVHGLVELGSGVHGRVSRAAPRRSCCPVCRSFGSRGRPTSALP